VTPEDRWRAIGRALDRLLELASQDPVLADGLRALTDTVAANLAGPSMPPPEVAPRSEVDAVAVVEPGALEPAAAASDIEPGVTTTVTDDLMVLGERDTAAVEREAVPMQPLELLRPIDLAAERIAAEQAARAVLEPTRVEQGRAGVSSAEPDAGEADLPLAGITTRARLRAEVARAVATRRRTGSPIDDGLLHRARSEGASLWMVDVQDPSPESLERFAESLDAVADAAELVILLRRYEPGDRARRVEAVCAVAAVQSALRIATLDLRRTADDDQTAAFQWVRHVTAEERIRVARHMKLHDPLDPAQLPEVVAPIQEELAVLKERAERQALERKRSQTLKHLAGLLATGRATAQQSDKLVQTVVEQVTAGTPPTSLLFRDLLYPALDLLPATDGRPAAYGRVVAALHEHRGRLTAAAEPDDLDAPGEQHDGIPGPVDSPSDAVRLAREHLGRVVIPDTAIEHIDEIDRAPNRGAWGRMTWRALRALNTYAEESISTGDFWDWCATSGHAYAWPATPKKLAMSESDTAMTSYREDRRFPVDPNVSDAGSVLMESHCKISEGGGPLAPRIYFHDDTDGVTGLIHVGYIGPHRYLRNASTN
jgi:hypothetical protein